jgi:lysophospholipase L1-like esterase
VLFSAVALAQSDPPKVVLIGDSIRIGYAPIVKKKLEGKAIIVSAEQNGADSKNVLSNLDDWVIREKPAIVHFNCGLHDLKFDKVKKTHQVPIDDYEKNLRKIVDRIRKESTAVLIFATTTPIHDERHSKRKANFDRLEADVQKYNAVAEKVMKEVQVPVNDLHAVVIKGVMEKLLSGDGTHYTKPGYETLADVVVAAIKPHLMAVKGK